MQEKEIKAILDNYKNGTASDAEIALLETWYMHHEEPTPDELGLEQRSQDLEDVFINLNKDFVRPKSRKLQRLIMAAAAISIILGLGAYLFVGKHKVSNVDNEKIVYANDVPPGKNAAVLTLANGKTINLLDVKPGNIGTQAGIRVVKAADGQLIYTVEEEGQTSSQLLYNTITTPKGGQYQVILPDGSKVWLNAASILKYPTNLNALNERRVELTGEAYFEIARLKGKIFVVGTAQQEVKVLGTHFNIQAYVDENGTKTTLLEGSVEVKTTSAKSTILKPGQQAIFKANQLKILTVDAEDEIDWKNGDFIFKDESLQSIMRKIARWYNVQVIYQADVPDNIQLEGFVSRSKSISEVLSLIQSTGKVQFKVEGRTITVLK